MRMYIYSMVMVVFLLVAGCQPKDEDESAGGQDVQTEVIPEPDYIAVQHILIGFQGSLPGKTVERTKEEAAELAQKLFERARAGEDFGKLVQEFTDDSYPGIYKMANTGVEPDEENGVYARERMVPAFGDTGFPLKVGEIGLARFDPEKSKYGWHIVKRVE